MSIKNHLWIKAKQLVSPNFNERPTVEISLLVIHNISLPPKQYGNNFIEQFFLNQLDSNQHPYFLSIKDLKVSSHLLIKRTGEVIQFVPFDKRAWHAGRSSFNEQENCNDYSIGIELEGVDNEPYDAVQYQQLNDIISHLKHHYPINNIVGHSDIAPSRKTDPGCAFDWSKIDIKR